MVQELKKLHFYFFGLRVINKFNQEIAHDFYAECEKVVNKSAEKMPSLQSSKEETFGPTTCSFIPQQAPPIVNLLRSPSHTGLGIQLEYKIVTISSDTKVPSNWIKPYNV